MKNLITAAILLLILAGCTKDEYPKQVLNIKATDCMYQISSGQVTFTYVSNVAGDESYKRQILSGICKESNIKDRSENYLWMDTCMILSAGRAYME